MKYIFLIHFSEPELKEKIKPLQAKGYKVDYHFSTEEVFKWEDYMPDVLVISLDRLPSHGKRYAEYIWEKKKWQHIPIVFAGGKPDKVDVVKKKFPDAIFTPNEKLVQSVEKVLMS